MRLAAVLGIAYLLGSIPFGYLIVRATAGADIRETGSGGTGATNVTRRAGRWAGILTLLLDAAKGAAAVLVAEWLLADIPNNGLWIAEAGVTAVIGHCFPAWLGFRGGKGVATALGVFAVLGPWSLLVFAIVFLVAVVTTSYVSLGSILGILAIPVFFIANFPLKWAPTKGPSEALLLELKGRLFASIVIAIIVVFMHRENTKRLINGTENKFR